MRKAEDILEDIRGYEVDHNPNGWPAIQMKQVSELCDLVESVVPGLDILQKHMEKGAYIAQQDGEWHLFAKDGVGIVSGSSIRNLIINLVFSDC